jgi:hypothetical protein
MKTYIFFRITQVVQHAHTLTPYEHMYANHIPMSTFESTTPLNLKLNSEKYEHSCQVKDLNAGGHKEPKQLLL